jgi:hypothetical protein
MVTDSASQPADLHIPFGAEPLPGLVSAFLIDADGVVEELDVDQPVRSSPGEFLWLHFNLANAPACMRLRAQESPCMGLFLSS